jgi:hypothetical protein
MKIRTVILVLIAIHLIGSLLSQVAVASPLPPHITEQQYIATVLECARTTPLDVAAIAQTRDKLSLHIGVTSSDIKKLLCAGSVFTMLQMEYTSEKQE